MGAVRWEWMESWDPKVLPAGWHPKWGDLPHSTCPALEYLHPTFIWLESSRFTAFLVSDLRCIHHTPFLCLWRSLAQQQQWPSFVLVLMEHQQSFWSRTYLGKPRHPCVHPFLLLCFQLFSFLSFSSALAFCSMLLMSHQKDSLAIPFSQAR